MSKPEDWVLDIEQVNLLVERTVNFLEAWNCPRCENFNATGTIVCSCCKWSIHDNNQDNPTKTE